MYINSEYFCIIYHVLSNKEKEMATLSSTLAWKIPWTEKPGRLQSMGSLRVGHDWVTSLSLFTFMHGEGNGSPLQCSCLENPRDGGAWWAAVYGVAQSRTRLKQLSSSSSSNKEYRFKTDYTLRKILAFIAGSSGVKMNLEGGFVQWFWLGSTSLVAQLVKNPPAMWETWVQSLGWEDPLEKGKATHSSISVWTRLSNFHFHGSLSCVPLPA